MLGWLMGGETDDKKRDASGRPMGFSKATRSHELLWMPAKMQHYD